MPPRSSRHRAASVYIVVLAGSLLVSLIGISALTAVRVQRRSAESAGDLIEARFYARSAIDMGLLWIETDPNWRDYRTSGSWADDVPIGTGTFSLSGVDPGDNNLSESDTDPVVLTGIGFKGNARHKTQVTLVAYHPPLSCLEVALHAGNDLLFSSAILQCDQTISANNSVVAASSMINSDVQAVNDISGGEYFGSKTMGITPRGMPDATTFEYYLANGTAISINSIPLDGERREVEDVVISPASNPYGAETNTEGIYVIDCLNQEIGIRNSRIVGTLVLVSPGSASKVDQSVNWQAAVGNYPTLLVAGSMGLDLDAGLLFEGERGVNFNPPGTPYNGSEDTDEADWYPSLIKGLVYVSGDVSTSSHPTIDGVVVVGVTLTGTGNLDLTYGQSFHDDPPPGFREPPEMRIAAGSWKQVVD